MLFEGIIILFSYAPLAQLVEQLTLNQMVGGSNPLWRTIQVYFKDKELLKL